MFTELQHFNGGKIQKPSLCWNTVLQGRNDKPACDDREVIPSQLPPHCCGQLEFMGQAHTDCFSVPQREQKHDGAAEGGVNLGAGLQISNRVIGKLLWQHQRMMVLPAKVCDAMNVVESCGAFSCTPCSAIFYS